MPGIYTHRRFAADVLGSVSALDGLTSHEHDAFVLGSQGPDPMLFASMRVVNPGLYTIGTRMHNEKTPELLAAVFAAADALEGEERGIGHAYALGFLCHYLLDSAVHPLVYGQQYACCSVKGVRGLGLRSLSETHACIETGIDEMLMVRDMGEGPAGRFDVAAYCLPRTPEVLDAVSTMFAGVIPALYGRKTPAGFFGSCVRGYHHVERAVDYARRTGLIPTWAPAGLFHLLPFFRQLGHSANPAPHTVFSNDDHMIWTSPFAPHLETSASFDELYGEALARSVELVGQLCRGTLTLATARVVCSGLNFKGAAIR